MPEMDLPGRLEALYQRWHHPRHLGTDPLVLVRDIGPPDREAAALIVSALALGRASLIIPAAKTILDLVGSPLAERLAEAPPGHWDARLAGFRYRFFSGAQVAALLDGLGEILRRFGTLEKAFAASGAGGWQALRDFAALFAREGRDLGILLPVQESGGAYKRLNLFLRWMVRSDGIDPGGWRHPAAADLFMPVDTHVLQWAQREGLTDRRAADQKACSQITDALRRLCPPDPLRWDFAITRQGMEDKRTLTRF